MYKYHGVFETFNFKRIIFSLQIFNSSEWEENFNYPLFVTEARNLGESF